MVPPRYRSDETKQNVAAFVRVILFIWRNPLALAAFMLLVGLNGGGAAKSFMDSRKPSVDTAAISKTVSAAVTEAMDPIKDTVREIRRDLGEVDRKVDRVAVQADKTDGDFRSHLLAYSWPSRVGRGAPRMQ